MKGAMPITISTIFAVSPSPNTMNRIGSTASGGIIDRTAMKGDSKHAQIRQQADGQPEDEADQRCERQSRGRAA